MTRYRGAGGAPQRGYRPRGGRRRRPELIDPTLAQNNRGVATVAREVVIPEEGITLQALADLLGTSMADIQKRLLLKGRMSNPNSALDYDTSRTLAEELGATLVDADGGDGGAADAASRTAMERHVLDEDEEN